MVIQLRAALDPLSELNPAGELQSITVKLADNSSNRAQFTTPPIPFPDGLTAPNDFLLAIILADLFIWMLA